MKFWQAIAFLDTRQALDIAKASDACGFDSVTVSEHLFFDPQLRSKYPYTPDGTPFWTAQTPWPDPWVVIGAMAAVTSRLRFSTNIYVAPARDLFTVAKLVSTAAVVSGGRVALGAGPGWCAEEFAQTGQDFHTRGKRLDEMISALRTLWLGGMAEHHGTFYDFGPVQISPVPEQPIPIYIGGDSDAALRRAATHGDGWVGNAYTDEAALAVLDRLDKALHEAGRSRDGFEVVLALTDRPEPDRYRRFADRGVTAVITAPWMAVQGEGATLPGRLAAIEQFAEHIISKV